MIEIRDHEVHVWHTSPEAVLAERPADQLLALLSDDEREHCRRALHERVRRERIVSKAMVRLCHSWYVDLSPQSWRFTTNAHGRPELVRPGGVPPLRFNVAHSHGVVVCAFALRRDVGVDVEDVSRRKLDVEVLTKYLSPSERAHIATLPRDRQRLVFLRYWTLKEAYAKARGLGLKLPFHTFSVDLSADPPSLGSTSEAPDWALDQFHVPPTHVVAVAARRPPGNRLEFVRGRVDGLATPPSVRPPR